MNRKLKKELSKVEKGLGKKVFTNITYAEWYEIMQRIGRQRFSEYLRNLIREDLKGDK